MATLFPRQRSIAGAYLRAIDGLHVKVCSCNKFFRNVCFVKKRFYIYTSGLTFLSVSRIPKSLGLKM